MAGLFLCGGALRDHRCVIQANAGTHMPCHRWSSRFNLDGSTRNQATLAFTASHGSLDTAEALLSMRNFCSDNRRPVRSSLPVPRRKRRLAGQWSHPWPCVRLCQYSFAARLALGCEFGRDRDTHLKGLE